MLGISKSNFSTTRLEHKYSMFSLYFQKPLPNMYMFFSQHFQGFHAKTFLNFFNHGGIRSQQTHCHHIYIYSKFFYSIFTDSKLKLSNIFQSWWNSIPSHCQTYIPNDFSQHYSGFQAKTFINFSSYCGIRSHHIVKHLQLSVKGFYIVAQGKLFALYGKSLVSKFEGRKSVLKCPQFSIFVLNCPQFNTKRIINCAKMLSKNDLKS